MVLIYVQKDRYLAMFPILNFHFLHLEKFGYLLKMILYVRACHLYLLQYVYIIYYSLVPSYQNNLTNSVSNIIGISELINSRLSYIKSTTEFSASPPTISSVASNILTALPHTTINITANITNTNYAYLAYRFKFSEKFTKIQMMDDGNNGDGAAGDGVFGITLDVDARDVQYYIYAENNDAGIFSPERAEKEFHQLPVVSGLVINEIMASNFTKVADQDGEYDDWVELYNGGSNAVNLSGFYLSDN